MTNSSPLVLRGQMIENRIRNIASELNITDAQAFMRLAYALLFNTQYDDPDYDTDLVDGGGDKQIDIIRIEETQDQATIHLVQVKNSGTYSGTVVVQMRDGLSWIFLRPEDQYSQLSNEDFVSKIREIRELSGRLGLRNLAVHVHYVAKGDTNGLSPDFKQEVQTTINEYANSDEFEEFVFHVWGINELVDRFYEIQQEKRRIDADLKIYYIWNVPTYLQYQVASIKSVICTVNGSEIARIVSQYGFQLFEENVRTYLGAKKINKEILKTCTDNSEAEYFWFFNNGITVTCDDFDIVYSTDPAIIKILNIQIVNGCQTSMTLKEAASAGELDSKTKVLLKVFATQDKHFVDRITLTTNSQNAVSSRDLSSNDQVQRYLEDLFQAKGYYYERKPGQFRDLSSRNERSRIISNEKAGQSHLAVVEHLPSMAMAHSNKIWSEPYYQTIFTSRVEELLGSYLIHAYCLDRSKELGRTFEGVDKTILKYSNFHLARVIGSLQIGEDWRRYSTQELRDLIKNLEQNPDMLTDDYERARTIIKHVVEELADGDTTKVINVLKSDKIQQRLDNLMKKTP